jgi:PAS domain S-box-containing protein
MTNASAVKKLLIVSLFLCIATGIATYYAYKKRNEARQWVDHTYRVIETSLLLLAHAKDVETNQRGWLVTHDSSFVETSSQSMIQLNRTLVLLREMTIDNTLQTKLIDESLVPPIRDEISWKNAASASDPTKKIQSSIDTLIAREKTLLSARYARLLNVTSFTETWSYTALLLIGITTTLAFATIRRVQKQNDELFSSLKENRDSLQAQVAGQTKEIRDFNERLQQQNQDLAAANEEIRASQEETKASLDYIVSLKSQLEKSERYHRLLTENSQDIIAVFSTDNKFVYVSPAVKKVLGYEPSEMIGIRGDHFVHPEDIQDLLKPSEIIEANDKVSIPPFRLRKKDGDYVWIESYTNPVIDENGTMVGIQTISRDITARKNAETAMLEAIARAEEATRAKSQFLSTMSHEIRTPMNAVIGLTNILLQNAPREDQVESLNLLKFSGENLLAILNDILDLSKIEAGKITLEVINFNLIELLQSNKNVHEKRAQEKGINLHFNMNASVPSLVKGDPVRLSQIVANLLSNAVKFTDSGSVTLSVDSKPGKNKKHLVHIQVSDTGIGIDNNKLEYIFESFSQASSDTTRVFGGTGLGLSITKQLVEMMGGTIHVKSTPGAGSTFIFEIEMDEGSHDALVNHPETFARSKHIFDNVKVLLVEDNRVNQIVVNNFLKGWGIQADFANNGKEAVKLIQNQNYKLILMDLQMPVMDGYAAASEIRGMNESYFKNVPIIALTASAMSEIRQKTIDAGMNDYISKPFNPLDLKNKIFKFLDLPIHDENPEPPWSENFNLYTQGDPDLRREMAAVMIKNIQELEAAVHALSKSEGLENFNRLIHKAKTTLHLLGDSEFEKIILQLKQVSEHPHKGDLQQSVQQFFSFSSRLVAGLQEENNGIG